MDEFFEIVAVIIEAAIRGQIQKPTSKRLLQAFIGVVACLLTSLVSLFVLSFFFPRQFVDFHPQSTMGFVTLVISVAFFALPIGAMGGLAGGSLMEDRGEQAQLIGAAITGGITALVMGGCFLFARL